MPIRFVHAADLHLGSPLKTVGANSQELKSKLEDATYTAFERIVDLAIDERVDFVLVSGDLYDQESRSVRANEFAVEQFERLNDVDIPVYLIYGNHDPVGKATTYFELPPNVYEFSEEDAHEELYPPDKPPKTRLWGQSYRTASDSRKMYHYYTPEDESLPNIGLLHTGLNPDGRRYAPCSRDDLRSKNEIHYWALGHIHKPGLVSEDPPIVYPGNPQGRQITEAGLRGCVLVEIDSSKNAEIEFVPTSPIVWQEVTVDVGEDSSNGARADGGVRTVETLTDLQDRLVDELYEYELDIEAAAASLPFDVRTEGWEPEGYVCRWELTGQGPIHDVLSEDDEALELVLGRLREEATDPQPFVWSESVRDRTRKQLPNVDDVWEDDEVFQELAGVLDELRSDPEMREVLEKKAGRVWYVPEDHEEEKPTELPLTDEKLEELLDRAEAKVVDELLVRRYT